MPKRIKFFQSTQDENLNKVEVDAMNPDTVPTPAPAPEVVVVEVPEPETEVETKVEPNKEEKEVEHIISEDEYSSWFTTTKEAEPTAVMIGEDEYLPSVIGNLAVAYETAPRTNKKQEDFPKYDRTTLNGISTVSGKIRYLHSKGLTKGQIAKVLGKLYQHVRAVLNQPAPKKGW